MPSFLITYKENSDGEVLRGDFPRVPLIGREGDWRLYATKDR